MRFGVIVPIYRHFARPDTFERLVARAEQLGYDAVWFADHIVIPDYAVSLYGEDFYEPITAMIFAAGRTRRIRFGLDVLVTPYRNPVLVAKMISTLDVLSGGRVLLGAGVGMLRGEFEALGVPFRHRGALTDEYLQAIRTLWTETAPSMNGSHVSFENVRFAPRPLQQPHPPIWIGGHSSRAMRRAATLGDGWHPLFLTPEQYRDGAETIRGLLRTTGRGDRFTFSYSCPQMCVTQTPWEPGSGEAMLPDLPAQMLEDYQSLDVNPPLAASGRPLLNGSPDEVAGDIQAFVDAGVEYMVTRFYASGDEIDEAAMTDSMERFAREVMPGF